MVGGSQSTQSEPKHGRGEHANSIQKEASQDLNQELFYFEALHGNHHTTMQPQFDLMWAENINKD